MATLRQPFALEVSEMLVLRALQLARDPGVDTDEAVDHLRRLADQRLLPLQLASAQIDGGVVSPVCARAGDVLERAIAELIAERGRSLITPPAAPVAGAGSGGG